MFKKYKVTLLYWSWEGVRHKTHAIMKKKSIKVSMLNLKMCTCKYMYTYMYM